MNLESWIIKIIVEPVSVAELQTLAEQGFGDMVKGVVDLELGIMAINGELHADEEAVLLEHGSKQANLWGINLYPDKTFPDMVEFNSMINIRPSQDNRSRGVEDPAVQKKIINLVKKLLK